MAKMTINDSTLTAIADAIRLKTETNETMLPGEMAALIESIAPGTEVKSGTVTKGSGDKTISLGIPLDTSKPHMLVVFHNTNGGSITGDTGTIYLCFYYKNGSTDIRRVIAQSSGSRTSNAYPMTITDSGVVTISSTATFNFHTSINYRWFWMEGLAS